MKRKIFLILSIVVFYMTMVSLPINVVASEGILKGDGSESNPWLIEDLKDLEQFRDNVNDTTASKNYRGEYIKLTTDLDMSSITNWIAIGKNSSYVFSGIFDGGNHTISNMTTGVNGGNAGLFGYNSGTIKNIKFNNCKISEGSGSTITDGGIVAAKNNANGIIYNIVVNNTIINVSSGSGSGYHGLGGIVGYNLGTIDSCANIGGSITSTTNMNYKRIGGIAGQSKGGVIRNSFNTANIDAKSSTVGGIVGDNNVYGDGYSRTIIENCYNWGAIKGHAQVGGVAGENTGGAYLKNSYNAGATTAIYGSDYAGSIVRNNTNGDINNAFGIVGGKDNSTSSLVGYGSCEAGQCHKVQNNPTELEALKNSLNAWVDAENTKAGKEVYKHWYIDLETGYPIFAPSVTITFNAGANGKFSDGSATKVINTYAGVTWDNSWVPDVEVNDGWLLDDWDKEFPTVVTKSEVFTFKYLKDENKNEIPDIYEKKVTFKIENGTWDGIDNKDKVVYVKLLDESGNYSEKGTGTLTVPTGMKANEGFTKGSWDKEVPVEVTGNNDETYTYSYQKIITKKVTFKIENGTWDGTDNKDKVVYVELLDELGNYSEKGTGTLTIPTGMKANEGYTNGAWDITVPNQITKDSADVYTYIFEENILGEGDVEPSEDENKNEEIETSDDITPENPSTIDNIWNYYIMLVFTTLTLAIMLKEYKKMNN